MMLERTNGHAHDEPAAHRLKRIEQRLAQLGDANRQRIDALRDAVSDLLASELVERDERIARLENQIADLTHKLEEKAAVNQIADEAILRIEARQAAREEGRRGPAGRQGERGARGEQGLPGARGPAGKPAALAPTIQGRGIDPAEFTITPFRSDGTQLPTLDLRLLFESYFNQTNA